MNVNYSIRKESPVKKNNLSRILLVSIAPTFAMMQ